MGINQSVFQHLRRFRWTISSSAAALIDDDRILATIAAEVAPLLTQVRVADCADAELRHLRPAISRSASACPDPEAARKHIAGELRMLRAARHIVLADMCRQLS